MIHFFMIFCLAAIVSGLDPTPARGDDTDFVSGVVKDETDAPAPGAVVRVRNTANSTIADSEGRFTLSSLEEGVEVELTAWAAGYYIASVHATPGAENVVLRLRPHHTSDNAGYAWKSPYLADNEGGCEECHPSIIDQWAGNAHGGAVSNSRFFSMYNGTDLGGGARVGPGFVDDFPETAGNCANCHAPGAGVDGYLTTNMNDVRDRLVAGVHCDYCHKIGGVYMNPATGSVYPNVPGVRGQRMLRPPEGEDIFFGPYDDVHDPDAHLPDISESRFCAPCHQFGFWGEPIYESYDEWLNSAYAERGVTCQDCHMPPNGDSYFALPEKGGLAHPPETIPSHRQLGASDAEFLRDALSLRLITRWDSGRLWVRVEIANYNAGHHVPTDYPGRNLILSVEAVDKDGAALAPAGGSTVPEWGGDLAGAPGKGFAKVLRDVMTGERPVVSYWKQTIIDEDNRIPANASDSAAWLFEADSGAVPITVRAKLRFRRLFHALSEAKGWDKPEILMEEAETIVREYSETRAPLPDVKLNGSDGPLAIGPGMAASVAVGLDPGDLAGQNADWWIWVDAPEGCFSYTHPGGWRPGIAPCARHALVFLPPPVELFNGSLPEGEYTFYFAVDDNADGARDATWSDSVRLYVK